VLSCRPCHGANRIRATCNGGMVEGTVQLTARSTPNRKPTAEAVGFVACVMASYAVAPKAILQAFWRVSIAAGFR
jgi:hypothetical protein